MAAFLNNTWYMGAWSDQLVVGQVLERTLLSQSLVLFRDSTGTAHALLNRCPHRFAPLHLGSCLPNGNLRCRYHGLEFDGTGTCVRNPHGNGQVPTQARVPAYPVAEHNGIVWIWMGAKELSDARLLPDFELIGDSRCQSARRYLHVGANYLLESDNILDLSHIQFLHPGTLASDSVAAAVPRVVQTGNTVSSCRFVQGDTLSPLLEQTFQLAPGTRADRWLDVRWDPPGSLLLTVSIGVSGRPREEANTILIPNIFTPETQSSTHYWFASCFERARYPDGEQRAQAHVEALMRPFATEDRPMLEAQQQVIGSADFWSLKPILLRGDEAAVRARRVMDKLIAEEQGDVGIEPH